MSSGSYQTRAGFREDLKPNGVGPCPTARYEARGPGVLFAGLCASCGRATSQRGGDGLPRHEVIPGLVA